MTDTIDAIIAMLGAMFLIGQAVLPLFIPHRPDGCAECRAYGLWPEEN